MLINVLFQSSYFLKFISSVLETTAFFRKKRGHQPTGILVHTAKATGFSSVSQLLHIQGSENLDVVKNVKAVSILPKMLLIQTICVI